MNNNMDIQEIDYIKSNINSITTRKNLLDVLNNVKIFEFGEKAKPFTLSQLMYHCNPKLNEKRYTTFEIPKKSGGVRTIMSPNIGLKTILFCVNKILEAIYIPNNNAYGFVQNRNIVDNATKHINQNYIFNIDLKDFFPSVSQARVWKRLQLKPFCFNVEIASILAGLCCNNSVLPQGAPTSPMLTNIICEKLDRKLNGLAKRFNLHYSRYADDITFSSMHNVYQVNSEFRNELQRIIAEQNFTINDKKTRLNKIGDKQEVTGLIVSDRVNTNKKYIKDIRTVLHNWEKDGYSKADILFQQIYNTNKGYVKKGKHRMELVIGGKLDFLRMVKGSDNECYKKLQERFNKLSENIPKEGFTSIININDFLTEQYKKETEIKKIYTEEYLNKILDDLINKDLQE
jgi:RNA-directed DNA polymerase